MTMPKITLWNNKSVPRMGIGTWVMGGEQFWNGQPTGWAGVDDAVSLRTLHTTFDLGVRIIDTADQYGAGHAEKVIAQAIRESALDRNEFVICTKVGMVCDPQNGNVIGVTDTVEDISAAIDASLTRLGVDYLDLVKFHLNHHPIERAEGVFAACHRAFQAGKIGGYGWSNDEVDGATAYADLDGYVAVQHDLNLFTPADRMLGAIHNRSLRSFNRQPLAMGLLTGKYSASSKPAGKNDIRGSGADWIKYFDRNGAPASEYLKTVATVRELLTADGRSLAQGALGWCLAQSDRTIPLPGCRTPGQAEDNFGTLQFGPLQPDIMVRLGELLKRDD